jgi:hypothetical protein
MDEFPHVSAEFAHCVSFPFQLRAMRSPYSGLISKGSAMSDAAMLARLNATTVTKDDIMLVVRESEELHKRDPNVELGGGIYLVARLFKGQPDKAQAIHFRMEAMAQLVEDGSLPGWTKPAASDGTISTAEAVFAATAVEPLVMIGKRAGFDRESFARTVLREAEVDGRA